MELSNVLWIGGQAGAGKTTAARHLARRHGLRRYSSDTQTWVHRDRALAAGVELPARGPGAEYYDRKPMIIDDLRSLPVAPLIVAEGGQISPAMAKPERQAVWLTRRGRFKSPGCGYVTAAKCPGGTCKPWNRRSSSLRIPVSPPSSSIL
jgi:hypothetical protein